MLSGNLECFWFWIADAAAATGPKALEVLTCQLEAALMRFLLSAGRFISQDTCSLFTSTAENLPVHSQNSRFNSELTQAHFYALILFELNTFKIWSLVDFLSFRAP